MGTCVHFSRSLPSNSWWQTMVGWQVLSRPSAAEGGGRRPAFTGLATQPYSATEVDGWQHKLSRVSQNRAAVQLCTKSQMAWTRPQPIGVFPNRLQATSDNFSVSQYRLPNRKTSDSSGNSWIECCCAKGATMSGSPESLTKAALAIRNRPGGATRRVHQLPKPSR